MLLLLLGVIKMNIYRVLLVMLLAVIYGCMFWGLPFFSGEGMEGVYILHGIALSCVILVFTCAWLLERC